jgi:sulfite exporter TauE/SafE
MDLALALSAFMLGLAGTPHCAAMCGASCAAVLSGCSGGAANTRATSAPALGFHLARVASYAVAGGLAAAGVGVLSMAGTAAPLMRPVWALLHMAALALGMWLLWSGRQPAFMTRIGRTRAIPTPVTPTAAAGWQPMVGPLSATAAGAAWVAWPCGLLQSALVVAALANTPQGGAAAMAAFAVASAAGLQLAPWLKTRLAGHSGFSASLAVRVAGLALALGSGWALGHDLWVRIADYCAT